VDAPYTGYISWPNFSLRANGNYQEIQALRPNPVLVDPRASGAIASCRPIRMRASERRLQARMLVSSTGTSKTRVGGSNIAVAFEPGAAGGPAVAQSTFHQFAGLHWDTRLGAPSFVDEPPGDAIHAPPFSGGDTRRYRAIWPLARRTSGSAPQRCVLSMVTELRHRIIRSTRISIAQDLGWLTIRRHDPEVLISAANLTGVAAEAAQMAVEAGLIYVSDAEPGIPALAWSGFDTSLRRTAGCSPPKN